MPILGSGGLTREARNGCKVAAELLRDERSTSKGIGPNSPEHPIYPNAVTPPLGRVPKARLERGGDGRTIFKKKAKTMDHQWGQSVLHRSRTGHDLISDEYHARPLKAS